MPDDDFEELWRRGSERQARRDRKQRATALLIGIDHTDEDHDTKLEAAGHTAGLEWAHRQGSDYRTIRRVAEAPFGFEHDYLRLAAVIAGVDPDIDFQEQPKDRDAVLETAYQVQQTLIPDPDADMAAGPGAEWTCGFVNAVREVWEESRTWIVKQRMKGGHPDQG